MNFLSHIFLSGNSEGLIIGNFIADSVKGTDYKLYSEDVQKGILLHRKIDTFTDAHDIVELSKDRLRAKYRKYATVIVDIYYDHFLAADFKDYSSVDLNVFTENVYSIIRPNHAVLPEKSVQFTKYMMLHNILFNYSKLEGIEKVLYGMSRRARFVSNMELAIEDLKEHYPLFENEFKSFFPELQEYVRKEIINYSL